LSDFAINYTTTLAFLAYHFTVYITTGSSTQRTDCKVAQSNHKI